jgi:hypothetical protein
MVLRSAGLLNDGFTVGGVESLEGLGPARVGDWRIAGICCRLFASRDWARPDLAGGCCMWPPPSSSVTGADLTWELGTCAPPELGV